MEVSIEATRSWQVHVLNALQHFYKPFFNLTSLFSYRKTNSHPWLLSTNWPKIQEVITSCLVVILIYYTSLSLHLLNYHILIHIYANIFIRSIYSSLALKMKSSVLELCGLLKKKTKQKNGKRSTILQSMGKFSFHLGKQLFWRLLPEVQGGIKFIRPYKSCVNYDS